MAGSCGNLQLFARIPADDSESDFQDIDVAGDLGNVLRFFLELDCSLSDDSMFFLDGMKSETGTFGRLFIGLLCALSLFQLVLAAASDPIKDHPDSPSATHVSQLEEPNRKPARIVSVNLGADQMLMELAPERVLGISYLSLDPKLSHVSDMAKKVSRTLKLDLEQILELQPELVVLGRTAPGEIFSTLGETGVKVFRFTEYQSVDGIQKSLTALGKAIGEESKAISMASSMEERLQKVSEGWSEHKKPRLLYYNPGGFTGGKGTFVDSIITKAGAVNVASEMGIYGTKKLSLESVIYQDPDYLLSMGSGRWNSVEVKEFFSNPAVKKLRAIRDGKVFLISPKYLFAPSHHVIEVIEELAEFIHGGVAKTQLEQ